MRAALDEAGIADPEERERCIVLMTALDDVRMAWLAERAEAARERAKAEMGKGGR